jgi:hypothetical protein
MTQFDFDERPLIGGMVPTWDVMKVALDEMADEDADLHEVRAITIVLLVSRVLKLPLARDLLIKAGSRNSAVLYLQPGKFEALVTKAERDPTVRFGADQVLALIDIQWANQASVRRPSARRASIQVSKIKGSSP